jgi:hypothetical protein
MHFTCGYGSLFAGQNRAAWNKPRSRGLENSIMNAGLTELANAVLKLGDLLELLLVRLHYMGQSPRLEINPQWPLATA